MLEKVHDPVVNSFYFSFLVNSKSEKVLSGRRTLKLKYPKIFDLQNYTLKGSI